MYRSNFGPQLITLTIAAVGWYTSGVKTYGKKRVEHCMRHIKGTSMACPCCIPRSTHRKSTTKVYKKAARREGKEAANGSAF